MLKQIYNFIRRVEREKLPLEWEEVHEGDLIRIKMKSFFTVIVAWNGIEGNLSLPTVKVAVTFHRKVVEEDFKGSFEFEYDKKNVEYFRYSEGFFMLKTRTLYITYYPRIQHLKISNRCG